MTKLLASSQDVARVASPPPSISILEFHIKCILTDIRRAPYILTVESLIRSSSAISSNSDDA
uniref:Uncharacterized protein n=1 Tax=Rhizophora mucronata TaxID=61149 RepID=A0A2P2PBT8_RHIMU